MYNPAHRTPTPDAAIRQEAALTLADTFRYRDPGVRVFSGTDALTHLHGEARRLRAQRAFAVCSPTVARESSLLDDVARTLGDLYAGAYTGAGRESPIPSVIAGVEAADPRRGADLIVAVGGGSAVVSARAITIMLAEEGTVYDLCTRHTPGQAPVSPRLVAPKLPNILVLTTPTNGANRGGAAVLDSKRPHRLELFDPKVRPTTIILDAAALLTAPLSLYLDTAATTFNGVVGALQSRNLNAFSHADLREALDLSLVNMPLLVENPEDAGPRLKLASAALLANRASDAAGLGGGGMSTSLDRQIRYRYESVGQGAGGAAFLCATMRRNRGALLAGQARLAELLGVRVAGMSDEAAADAAVEAVADFLSSVGMPTRVRDLGVPEEDLRSIAEDDAEEPSFSWGAPRADAADDLHAFLKEAW